MSKLKKPRHVIIFGLLLAFTIISISIAMAVRITFSKPQLPFISVHEHRIMVEIAQTAEKHALGLMYRVELPEGHGMLFVFPNESIRPFWMKNTYVSLDIIWINSDHTVVHIKKAAPVLDDTPITPPVAAQYVLEINAGESDEWGIKVGDTIEMNHLKIGESRKI